MNVYSFIFSKQMMSSKGGNANANANPSGAEKTMTIYVFDETTSVSRNFTCRQHLLLEHMKYLFSSVEIYFYVYLCQ